MPTIADVLEAVTARAAGLPRAVVVLDLDSTLIDTGPRHLAILRAYGAATGHDVASVLDWYAQRPVGWGLTPGFEACGWSDADQATFHRFWGERFFDGESCRHDEAVPGAVAFVRRIVEQGGIAYYLTARPAPTMGEATVGTLRALGFPILRGRAVLHLKPSPHLSDHRFKRGALQEPATLGEVVATFENEPAHAHAFQATWPAAMHFLVGSVRSPDAPPPDGGLIAIPDLHVPG